VRQAAEGSCIERGELKEGRKWTINFAVGVGASCMHACGFQVQKEIAERKGRKEIVLELLMAS